MSSSGTVLIAPMVEMNAVTLTGESSQLQPTSAPSSSSSENYKLERSSVLTVETEISLPESLAYSQLSHSDHFS